MKRLIIAIITMTIVAFSNIVSAQTNGKTISQLQTEKATAIKNENYELAAEIKKLIIQKTDKLEQSGGKTITQLNVEKAEAISNEDYKRASEIKEQIQKRKDYLNTELNLAVTSENYEKAASIKKELNDNTKTTSNHITDNNMKNNANSLNQNKTVKSEQTSNTSTESVKEQLLTFEKEGVINLNYGLNNKFTKEFKQNGFETSSIILEVMYLNSRKKLSPVVTLQYAKCAIEMEEYGGEYMSTTISMNQDHLGIGGGVGVSTNFGLDKSKIHPYALITIGVQYINVTSGDSENLAPEIGASSVGAQYNIRVGATYYFTDRLGIIFGAGINNQTNLTLGLIF